MNKVIKCFAVVFGVVLALCFLTGCPAEKTKELTKHDQLELRNLRAEATFALNLKDYPRAEKAMARAAEINPCDADIWISYGMLHKRQGKIDEAKKAYKKAKSCCEKDYKRTKSGMSLVKRAQVLALLGDVDDAKSALEKARKLHPDEADVQKATGPQGLVRAFDDPKFKEVSLKND